MCPPGLHLSLGIFLRLFNLLEAACKKLDLRVHLNNVGAGPTYERYMEAFSEQRNIKEKAQQEEAQIMSLEQAALLLTLSITNPANNPKCSQLHVLIAQKKAQLIKLVS